MARRRRAGKDTPKVIVGCVADAYSEENERVIEFTFADGRGGLIRFAQEDTEDGDTRPRIEIYRTDAGIRIGLPGSSVWHHTPAKR